MKLSECENSGNLQPNRCAHELFSDQVQNTWIIANNKCVTLDARFFYFFQIASMFAALFRKWTVDSNGVPDTVQKRYRIGKIHFIKENELEMREPKNSMESASHHFAPLRTLSQLLPESSCEPETWRNLSSAAQSRRY